MVDMVRSTLSENWPQILHVRRMYFSSWNQFPHSQRNRWPELQEKGFERFWIQRPFYLKNWSIITNHNYIYLFLTTSPNHIIFLSIIYWLFLFGLFPLRFVKINRFDLCSIKINHSTTLKIATFKKNGKTYLYEIGKTYLYENW